VIIGFCLKFWPFCSRNSDNEGSETAVRTALIYYCIHRGFYTVQGLYTVYNDAGVQSTVVVLQEANYVEGWPNTTSAWAGWSRFDIQVARYGGVHSLLICTSSPLRFPTCHRASQQDNTY
jgi:hypothetical protein